MTTAEDPMPPAGPYAAAVTAYWRAGWHGLLPLAPRSKKGTPPGWHGYAGAWPSWPDVQAWVEERGNGNIALRLPRHLIGIDVDEYGDKRGGERLAELEATWGKLPPTWTSTSRDGVSGIRLFRVPEGLKWPGDLGEGIEVIHTGNRYMVVAPSLHPEGRPYRWSTPQGATVLPGVVPGTDDPSDLPDPWVVGITGGEAHTDTPRADIDDDQARAWLMTDFDNEPCEHMSTALARYLTDLRSGGHARHSAALAGSARLCHLHGDGHRGAVAALETLRRAWLDTLATSRTTQEGHRRVVQNGSRRRAHRRRRQPQPGSTDPCDWPVTLTEPGTQDEPTPSRVYSPTDDANALRLVDGHGPHYAESPTCPAGGGGTARAGAATTTAPTSARPPGPGPRGCHSTTPRTSCSSATPCPRPGSADASGSPRPTPASRSAPRTSTRTRCCSTPAPASSTCAPATSARTTRAFC